MTDRELLRAYRLAATRSASLATDRGNMPPGSSRAAVTTINAQWARAAEERERLRRMLEERGLSHD